MTPSSKLTPKLTPSRGEETDPFVSVVLPVRNEAAFISRSLRSVLAQDYPHARMEVLVADGMSTDQTRAEIERLAAESDIPVTAFDNPGRIVPTGLNTALDRARGAVIVRVDGHTVLAPDYVRQCLSALARSGADNVGGRMHAVSETPLGEAVALATSSRFGVGGARFHYSEREEWVDTVYMGCWPRSVFDRIGFFDEEMVRNQDDELNYRLLSLGGRILLSPQIRSRYYNRATLPSLWRQYFQYGYWKVRVMQKHPGQMRVRQFVPPALAAFLVVSLLLVRLTWRPFALGAACYAVADILASFWAAGRRNLRVLPLLPVVFATLHFSYGFGFLTGLAKFAGRWGDRKVRSSGAGADPFAPGIGPALPAQEKTLE